MQILLEKGLSPCSDLVDMWDIWHRRQRTDERKALPRDKEVWWEAASEVKQFHDEYTRNSLCLSNPIVVLAVGRIAQRWITQEAQERVSLSLDNVHIHVHLRNNIVQRLVCRLSASREHVLCACTDLW